LLYSDFKLQFDMSINTMLQNVKNRGGVSTKLSANVS